MLLILLFLLVALALIALCVNGRDFLSPSFVLIVFFIVGTAFAFYGNLSWGIEIHDSRFIMAILGGLSSILMGEMLASKKLSFINVSQAKYLNYSCWKVVLLIIVNAIIVYLFYKRVYAIAVNAGFTGENLQMYVRVATSLGGVKFGLFFTFFIWILQASAFVFFYTFINNCLVEKRCRMTSVLLLIPVGLYFVQVYLSGARAGLVRFFILIAFLFFFLYRCINKEVHVVRAAVVTLSLLFVLLYSFAFLGTLTKKVDESDFLNPICIYTGSSIIALDDWLQKNLVLESENIGSASFSGVYTLVNVLRGEKTHSAPDESNFVRKGEFSTNIYTGFRAYLSDFGWPGLCGICLFLGYIFRRAYQYVVEHPFPVNVLIYTYFFIDFLYLLFAQSITSNLMTPVSLMGLAWIILVYFFMFSKEGN